MDQFGLIFTLLILILTGTGIELVSLQSLRVIAAFASCFTIMKLFDWLRLFEDTGFYVLLVEETLFDIRFFLLLLLTTLMMFGVPLVMLDANSHDGKEIIEGTFNFWIADLVYN